MIKCKLVCGDVKRESCVYDLKPWESPRPFLRLFAKSAGVVVKSISPCSWIGGRGLDIGPDGYTEWENYVGLSSRGDVRCAFWVKEV